MTVQSHGKKLSSLEYFLKACTPSSQIVISPEFNQCWGTLFCVTRMIITADVEFHARAREAQDFAAVELKNNHFSNI